MNEELISVIVPIYNGEKYLAECVYSIINQTYKNIEILLMNDGSTDSSLSLCENFAKEDNRIRVINKKNTGVSDTRNKGVEMSNGKYILFVDCDDYLEKNMVEKMLDVALSNNVDVVRCNKNGYKKQGGYYLEDFHGLANQVLDKTQICENLYRFITLKNKIGCYVMTLLILRKKIVKFDTELYFMEDVEFYIRLLQSINSMYFLDEPLYHYRYNDTSVARAAKNCKRNISGMLRSVQKIKENLVRGNILTESLDRNINNYGFHIVLSIINCLSCLHIREIVNEMDIIFKNEEVMQILNKLDYKSLDRNKKIQLFIVRNSLFYIWIINRFKS